MTYGLGDLLTKAIAFLLIPVYTRYLSTGDYGILGIASTITAVLGIIYPPQLALVGFGRITERPVVVDGKVVAHSIVTASLSADHRATDGYHGSRFLRLLDQKLQQPELL